MAGKLDGEGETLNGKQTVRTNPAFKAASARCPRSSWKTLFRRSALLPGLIFLAHTASAHIGSPNVIFEGLAGPYPVRVTIRPPGVIPGLAEISIRVQAGHASRVTALPVHWNAGKQGAPPPDVASLVHGETNLYSAELWFMRDGAESVEVEIAGDGAKGSILVPVNAVAFRRLALPRFLGGILAALGVVLVSLGVTVVRAAVRQSVLAPGLVPDARTRWRFRLVTALVTALFLGLVALGKRWWDSEDFAYRNNRLYRPIETQAEARIENGHRLLRLTVDDWSRRSSRPAAPLVPDHGKLMHLFLVREPAMDAFAHLHPVKRGRRTFDALLPGLPAGRYRVYADITEETGLAHTLTAEVEMPAAPEKIADNTGPGDVQDTKGVALDSDDSWWVGEGSGPAAAGHDSKSRERIYRLSDEYSLHWLPSGPLVEGREAQLRFAVRDGAGKLVAVELYMGMLSHAVLRRDDGSVFTHLHPSGTFSMAAMQLFALRVEGKLPLTAAFGKEDPLCRLPGVEESQGEWLKMSLPQRDYSFAIPYEFPKPGRYRLWVQVKISGRVFTGMFDAEILPAKS